MAKVIVTSLMRDKVNNLLDSIGQHPKAQGILLFSSKGDLELGTKGNFALFYDLMHDLCI